ncbi:MAG TPA: peptidoglycan-binding protein LysM [Leucothrix sp.]|nr:peptidoglycan-binding protein LysM [Leucothrix sp.]
MGLFDFAKNIGNKIFGSDDDDGAVSDKLKQHIEKDNPGIDNLQIDVVDGVATIKGKTDDPSALEKVILMAGNAMGIEEVRADEVSSPAQTYEVQYYEIEKGDSLWAIAKKFYGDGNKYTKIFDANREVIKDADLIFPGQKIRIPMD